VEVFNFVTSVSASIRGEYELADVINHMINNGYRALGLKQSSIIEPIFEQQGNH
jgi:dTDP-glucose pyrophosphorylase